MPDPRGRIQIFRAMPFELQALLYNFDINSAVLKPEHHIWITQTIAVHPPPHPGVDVTPQRTSHMTWGLIGLASRSGSDALNWQLARRRAEAVSQAIWSLDPTVPRDEIKFGVGEEAAWLAGLKDGLEDERWRSVFVHLYDPTKIKIYRVVTRPTIPMPRRSYVKFMLKDKPGKSIPMDPQDKRAEAIMQASREAQQYLFEPEPMDDNIIWVPDTWTVVQVEYWKTSGTGGGWEFEHLEVKYTWNLLPRGESRKLVCRTSGAFRTSDMSPDEMRAWLKKPLTTYRRFTTGLPIK